MNASLLCPCGQVPTLGKTQEKALYFVSCSACKRYGEPQATEAAAVGIWNRLNRIDTTCLGCQQLPIPRYIAARRHWLLQCTGCGYYSGMSISAQGAIHAWCAENRPGDPHILELWQFTRQRHQSARQASAST